MEDIQAKSDPEVIKTVFDMTREEIENVPNRIWNEDIGEFDSLVILPMEEIHDSGFRCMDFIAIKDGQPIRRLSGCSDVINIGGIGGQTYKSHPFNQFVKCTSWSIDCLRESGLLRLFNHEKLTCGSALSSFEVFLTENKKTH